MLNMSVFETVKAYADFKYWFKIDTYADTLEIINKESGESEKLAEFSKHLQNSNVENAIRKDYVDDWISFTERPEYDVYAPIQVSYSNVNDMIDCYERLLIGTTMMIAESEDMDPDCTVDRTFKCLKWLRTTDFYSCPSSRVYHDSFVGGLLYHSLKVASAVQDLYKTYTFAGKVQLARAIRASLVHDWCKIGLYESYEKNVRDSKTGMWYPETAYKYREDRATLLGHGASSMFLASRFFKLSYEEALAIRWHMGEFNVAGSEMEELSQACRRYPLVYMIQFADRLSCVDWL